MAAAKRALAQTKDGGIAFAASTKKGGDALITMVNFDIWGNESCAEAGSCESAKASSCDDKDPCTVDRCTAKSGCKHTAHAEGALCGLNSYCVAGKCTKAPQDMAFVPKGKFWMGCSAKDGSCKSSEKPQHEVVLSSYWIDMYEVTVSDWGKCKAAGKCSNPKGTYSSCNWGKPGREQHPINCIDWSQARGYCQWLGAEFDLPTEAQWEKAARGGCEHNGGGAGCKSGMQTYPWGEASPTCDVAVFSSDGKGCGKDSTWAVGSKPKGVSPYGAHDMSGNVWEWVLDWYADNFYSKSSKNDPVNNQSASDRVGRGGSWDGPADYLRAGGYRLGFYPGHDWPDLGFRCAR